MLLALMQRTDLIKQIGADRVDSMVELGVYKGEFSEFCYKNLRPKSMTLIDMWNYEAYQFVLRSSPQMLHLEEVYEQYFENDPRRVLAEAYEQTKARFVAEPGVRVIKSDISVAAEEFIDGSLDLIYLDGNHTYEFVLRDLYTWFPKLKPGGIFICNDFCESRTASRQNIGVVPAFNTFSKRFKIYPIVMNAEMWGDIYFSNQPTSPLIERFLSNVYQSEFAVFEIPNELIVHFHHRLIQSRGAGIRLLPSFRADNAYDEDV